MSELADPGWTWVRHITFFQFSLNTAADRTRTILLQFMAKVIHCTIKIEDLNDL